MLDWVVLTGAGRASFGSKEGLRDGFALAAVGGNEPFAKLAKAR
jgi:hypothetical protein